MGRDKAFVTVEGRPMAELVSTALEDGGCRPVVTVGGDGVRLPATTGLAHVADTRPGEGPLGGVIDALRWFAPLGVDAVVVAACDLPRLSPEAVRAVAGAAGAAVAVTDRRHPSLARWPIGVVAGLEELFESGGRSLGAALEAVGATEIHVPDDAVRNVNRPADIAD